MQIIQLILRGKISDNLNNNYLNNDSPLSLDNFNKNNLNQYVSNNFEFDIDMSDTLFTLAYNPSVFKKGGGNLINKMTIINTYIKINIDDLSLVLFNMNIKKLHIFCINNTIINATINVVTTNKGCDIKYIEMNSETFVKYLNHNTEFFLEFNKKCLYILRDGNFLNIKNLFATIENCTINVGRGGSQKSHMLSPLDFRLSFYMMAMFNQDYQLVSELNTFNYISKDRYLSYKGKPYKNLSLVENNNSNLVFKPIIIEKMPWYSKIKDLGEYYSECP
jgi:hypothetical protein